jgi:hypothetical protein
MKTMPESFGIVPPEAAPIEKRPFFANLTLPEIKKSGYIIFTVADIPRAGQHRQGSRRHEHACYASLVRNISRLQQSAFLPYREAVISTPSSFPVLSFTKKTSTGGNRYGSESFGYRHQRAVR